MIGEDCDHSANFFSGGGFIGGKFHQCLSQTRESQTRHNMFNDLDLFDVLFMMVSCKFLLIKYLGFEASKFGATFSKGGQVLHFVHLT